jgi:hypothetical protein
MMPVLDARRDHLQRPFLPCHGYMDRTVGTTFTHAA